MKLNNKKKYLNECELIARIMAIDYPLHLFKGEISDWEFVRRTLLDSRLAGFAYWRFVSQEVTLCPSYILSELEQHYQINQFSNILLLQEAGKAIRSLNENSVYPIALKGIALLDKIFCIGARKLGDIDLLVSPDQALIAVKVLEGIGYVKKTELDLSDGCCDLHLQCGNMAVPIDLSWKLIHRTKRSTKHILNVDAVRLRCKKSNIANEEVLVLDVVDQVLHSAVHIVLHHDLQFPPGLVDLYAILYQEKNFDWKELEIRARKSGFFKSVTVAMGILYELFGFPVGGCFLSEWDKIKKQFNYGPHRGLLNKIWVLGATKDHYIKLKGGGLIRNITRFYFVNSLYDNFIDKITSYISLLIPDDELIDKAYNVKHSVLKWIFKALHIPAIFIGLIVFSVILSPLVHLLYFLLSITVNRELDIEIK